MADAGCDPHHPCQAQALKKPREPRKAPPGTGWIDGIYNGGPGDPIIAPLRSR